MINSDLNTLILRMCSIILVLSLIVASTRGNSKNIVLTLQSQDRFLNEYSCKINKLQTRHSKLVTKLLENKLDAVDHASTDHDNGDIKVPLPYDQDKEFLKVGFNDTCDYFQNDIFKQHYQIPMPLLLNDSNDFYTDVTQLNDHEKEFMKQIESFDHSNNNNINNPFAIDMTRMNNLFKIAEFLQMERLLRIIAARQASLMTNMNKNQMIQWLLDSDNTKKQMMIGKNNNDDIHSNRNDSNDQNPKTPQTPSCNSHDNDSAISTINEINRYNWAKLTEMLPFFSCYTIHTFSSISKEFYDFAHEWWHINLDIDAMVKVLTNNNESTCLSLTDEEVIFYKPFLTLPQYKWSANQNNTYNQLKTLTNNMITVGYIQRFSFETLILFDDRYTLHTLQCGVEDHLIRISTNICLPKSKRISFNSISFRFSNFAQKVNIFAQLRNIKHIKISIGNSDHLSSLNDLIGIYDIDNIKTLHMYNLQHAFSINNFDALKRLTNLEVISVYNNEFDNNKLDTECLDFSFLHNLPNLKEMDFTNNQIECIDNFMAIQKHSNLVNLKLARNKISSLDLNAFQGTNLKHIDLSENKLTILNHDDTDTSQLQPCLDFNSFNNMQQLKTLCLDGNQIRCIINFESIQRHTQLEKLYLGGNHLLTPIDFTKFDESMPSMNHLAWVRFDNMTLKYTRQNNNCLDLQFLNFMPNAQGLYLSYNEIECIDSVSILQREDIKLIELYLQNNNLFSFDFSHLIGSNIDQIHLTYNNLTSQSVKNFDFDTLSKIKPSGRVYIHIPQGNNVELPSKTPKRVFFSY